MYRFPKVIFLLGSWLLAGGTLLTAQESLSKSTATATQYLSARGEVIIRFEKPSTISLDYIASFLSIDDFRSDSVTAYADEVGFTRFLGMNIPYEVMPPPSLRTPCTTHRKTGTTDWNGQYLTYPEYIQLMEKFETDFPDLCHLHQFGTSIEGRKLLALKITDNPQIAEREPAVLYSSSMHGDEPLGYVLMLRLIDHLLTNYPTNPEISEMINRLEIWINPLANPDGTFFLSDTSVFGATRFNANQVDLNRDFPDIRSDAWKSELRQQETTAMMAFMELIRPVLSANFHGGVEVVNYPMDSWSRLHPDDGWYRSISRAYADTAQFFGPPGYMTFLDNGITNGNAWYSVYGGRQDYVNIVLHGREVTIELSNDKVPPEDDLEGYWQYNQKSLLQYLLQALTGVTGVVTDSLTGLPVKAEIRILYHDYDSSYAVSGENDGVYYRLISEGDYVLQASAAGYYTENRPVTITDDIISEMNYRLIPNIEWAIFPNPFLNELNIYIEVPGDEIILEMVDLLGRKVKQLRQPVAYSGLQKIRLNQLSPGTYVVLLNYRDTAIRQVMIKSVE